MHGAALVAFLKTTELLCDLPHEDLPAIARELELITLTPGEVLFEEGDAGDAAYLIAEGEIAMVSDGVELVRRSRGGCVGEFALLDDEPRSTTVVACTALTLLRWRREHFLRALAEDYDIARGLVRMLTRKLRSDVERGVDLIMERERWRQDMSRAREIQSGMLPPQCMEIGELKLAACCAPAADVGGDFYDYLQLPHGEVAITIGDVTGHGFYSGLFVAMAKSCLYTQVRFDHDPRSVMDALRRAVELSLYRQLFMTCAYLLINLETGVLRYAIAGHPNPMHYEAATGRVKHLEVLDPILGALDVGERPFNVHECRFEAGDALMLYSDGITETRSPSGQEFGVDRLRREFARHAIAAPQRARDAILEAVLDHAAGSAQADDLTLVVARRAEASGTNR